MGRAVGGWAAGTAQPPHFLRLLTFGLIIETHHMYSSGDSA